MNVDKEYRDAPRRGSWARAFALVAILSILVGAGTALYVLRTVRELPASMAESGREVLDGIDRIAEAFKSGTITTLFLSYATEITGTSHLQFATLRQTEVFERRDARTAMWGALELPEVIVEARAPVEYTYYLDLDDKWELLLEDRTIQVMAPPIEFNMPAVDPSEIRYEVREGSVFRNEQKVLEELRASLTELARRRASENIPLVREIGRRRTEEFVRRFLVSHFDDWASYRIEVFFPGELPRRPEGDRPQIGLARPGTEPESGRAGRVPPAR